MNTTWNTVKMLGVLAAGMIGGTATDRVIDAGTHIPIGVAVSVTVTAVGVAIAISRALQRLQDSVDDLKKLYEDLPCVGPAVKVNKKDECREDEKG